MTPYLASLGWYAARIAGECAVPHKGRWNRAVIAPGQMLTIPVRGGISAVKHGDPELWTPDDTRTWRHTHLGAVNACLGRMPYYQHYAPELTRIIADRSLDSVAAVNDSIDRMVHAALDFGSLRHIVGIGDTALVRRLAVYSEHLSADIDTGMSVMSYMMRFGPDTIFFVARAFIMREKDSI